MTEVLITVPCSDEIKLRLEEFKNSCVFLFKDRKSDIGSAEVVIGEPRTERIREAKNNWQSIWNTIIWIKGIC
jgi:hypothetical protein